MTINSIEHDLYRAELLGDDARVQEIRLTMVENEVYEMRQSAEKLEHSCRLNQVGDWIEGTDYCPPCVIEGHYLSLEDALW